MGKHCREDLVIKFYVHTYNPKEKNQELTRATRDKINTFAQALTASPSFTLMKMLYSGRPKVS